MIKAINAMDMDGNKLEKEDESDKVRAKNLRILTRIPTLQKTLSDDFHDVPKSPAAILFDHNQQSSSPKSENLIGIGEHGADIKWVNSVELDGHKKKESHELTKLMNEVSSYELQFNEHKNKLSPLNIKKLSDSDEDIFAPNTPKTRDYVLAEIHREHHESGRGLSPYDLLAGAVSRLGTVTAARAVAAPRLHHCLQLYSLQWRLPIDQSINWTMGKTRSVRTVPNNGLEMAAVKGGCIRLESA
uniref:Uncharacterized protein n=1 Tax=Globodera rostochiensis TaxID=31243 RepID=A0A914HZY7_GLORO